MSLESIMETPLPTNITTERLEILNGETEGKIEVETPEDALEIAVSYAYWSLEQKYGPESDAPKTFHDVGHTEMIASVCSIISEKLIQNNLGHVLLGVTEEDYIKMEDRDLKMRTALAYQTLLAWMHDNKQDGEVKDVKHLGVDIKQLFRNRGVELTQNEGGSGQDLSNLLSKFVYKNGKPVFEGYDQARCVKDTNATFVNYEYVEEYGFALLNQTYFKDASIFGQLLALTDLASNLGTELTDTPSFRNIVETGNREFAELYPELLDLLATRSADSRQRFAAVQKAYAWINPMQVNFVSTQVTAKDMHIEHMATEHDSPLLGEVLKEVFGGSVSIVSEVTVRASRLEHMVLDAPDMEGVELGTWVDKTATWLGQEGHVRENDIPLLDKAAEILAKELSY